MPDRESSRMIDLLEEIVRITTEINTIALDPDAPMLQPPAIREDIDRVERLFGVPLPPSYRRFLEITDGVPHFTSGFDLLSTRQILGPEYAAEVGRRRTNAWDTGQPGPIQGLFVGLKPRFNGCVLLDTTRPTGHGELLVVYWHFESLGEAPTFEDFLDYWSGVKKRVLENVRRDVAKQKGQDH
jgi:hypothetical protein